MDKQEILWGLLQHEANKKCMDCHEPNPLFACITTGTFICPNCAQIHRTELGHSIKPISGVFTDEEIRWFQSQGNAVARRKWLGRWTSAEFPEPATDDLNRLRQFLLLTYIDKKWVLEKPLPPLPPYAVFHNNNDVIHTNGVTSQQPMITSPRNSSPLLDFGLGGGNTENELVEIALTKEKVISSMPLPHQQIPIDFSNMPLTDLPPNPHLPYNAYLQQNQMPQSPQNLIDMSGVGLPQHNVPLYRNIVSPPPIVQNPNRSLLDLTPGKELPQNPFPDNGVHSNGHINPFIDSPLKDPVNVNRVSNPFTDPQPVISPQTLRRSPPIMEVGLNVSSPPQQQQQQSQSPNPITPQIQPQQLQANNIITVLAQGQQQQQQNHTNPFIEASAPYSSQMPVGKNVENNDKHRVFAPNGGNTLPTSDPTRSPPVINPFTSNNEDIVPSLPTTTSTQMHNPNANLQNIQNMSNIQNISNIPNSNPFSNHISHNESPHNLVSPIHGQINLPLPQAATSSPLHTPSGPSPLIPRHPQQANGNITPDGATPYNGNGTANGNAEKDEVKMLEEVRALKQLFEMGMMDKGEYEARRIQLVNQLTRTSHATPTPPTNAPITAVPQHLPDPRLTGTERAIRHRYDAKKGKWCHTATIVIIEPTPFAEGAMRKAFRMRDLSQEGPASQMVCKQFKDPSEDRTTYFREVEMQMQAKEIAERFNRRNPPKKVDFVTCFVMELVDRPPIPTSGVNSSPPLRQICSVEYFIDGKYEKHNNNYGYKNEHDRNTPQAFSHFSYEDSNFQLIVVDIQGVADMYTDPQIHSADGLGYGKGNLGVEGINKFFSTHNCNSICHYLGLTAINPKPPSDCGTRPQLSMAHPNNVYDSKFNFQTDPFDILRNSQQWPKS